MSMNQELFPTPPTTFPELIVKGFIHAGEVYIYSYPSKALFNSNLIHDVIRRGDIFAVRVSTGNLIIFPGKTQVIKIQFPVPKHVFALET